MTIDFTLKNYRCFSDQQPARFRVSKGIHAFVGPNNAGKSSILRFLVDFRSLFQNLGNWNEVLPTIQNKTATINFAQHSSVRDVNELFFDRNDRNLEVELEVSWTNEDSSRYPSVLLPTKFKFVVPRSTNSSRFQMWVGDVELQGNCSLDNNGILHYPFPTGGSQQMSWRAVRDLFQSLASTMYIGPFRNAINLGATNTYFDIQAGQAFIKTWKNYKSGGNKTNSEACHLLEQQIKRIFGYTDLQINALTNDDELQILADGRSYNSADTGAGLLQFVIVLANAAVSRRDYILIDEPELNLHPTLQLNFLTTIASYARQGVLFASHNIGLARASAEKIYSVRRNGTTGQTDVKPFEATKNLTELLGELGFNAYSDLGFSKILLVEGPTDLKAVQQFLRLLGKDHEIVLLPLGGTSMINGQRSDELAELKRITSNISALIDSEKDAPTAAISHDRRAFSDECQRQGIHCHVLEHRAIENYLTNSAVKTTKGPKYSMLSPYEKLETANPAWAKNENWLIARSMTLADLQATDLGRFLHSL